MNFCGCDLIKCETWWLDLQLVRLWFYLWSVFEDSGRINNFGSLLMSATEHYGGLNQYVTSFIYDWLLSGRSLGDTSKSFSIYQPTSVMHPRDKASCPNVKEVGRSARPGTEQMQNTYKSM